MFASNAKNGQQILCSLHRFLSCFADERKQKSVQILCFPLKFPSRSNIFSPPAVPPPPCNLTSPGGACRLTGSAIHCSSPAHPPHPHLTYPSSDEVTHDNPDLTNGSFLPYPPPFPPLNSCCTSGQQNGPVPSLSLCSWTKCSSRPRPRVSSCRGTRETTDTQVTSIVLWSTTKIRLCNSSNRISQSDYATPSALQAFSLCLQIRV